jgi:KaiC/GvpD/RAD55 family RecA-like ATPase
MGTARTIPRELQDFLQLPGAQSLLVRGPPGSGKTSLSLALLESYSGARYFVTNRVPGDDVRLSFPWLGNKNGHHIDLLDNTAPDAGLAHASEVLTHHGSRLLDDSTPAARELAEFLWLPTPLQDAWSRLDPAKPSLVVIDSWDALVESYLGDRPPALGQDLPTRPEIERALLRRMGSGRTHLVFVLEREEQTQLDYLVNGVAVTSREVVDGRLERWLTLYKLRGVRIETAHYPFSLEGAHFECITPVRVYQQIQGGGFDRAPDAMPDHLWPGSRAFAESFGRLPLGKSSLLEIEKDVPNQVPYVLIAPIVAHTLDRGGRVIFVPDASTLPDDVWDSLHGSVERRRFLEQVRFLLPPAGPNEQKSEFEPTVVRPGAPTGAGGAAGGMNLDEFLRAGATPERPGLFVVFLQGLGAIAGARGLPVAGDAALRLPAQIQSAVRGASLHALAVGSSDSPLFDPLRPTAALRLHLRQRQGRVLVYGSDPWTPAFLLTEGHDSSPYGLLRVV